MGRSRPSTAAMTSTLLASTCSTSFRRVGLLTAVTRQHPLDDWAKPFNLADLDQITRYWGDLALGPHRIGQHSKASLIGHHIGFTPVDSHNAASTAAFGPDAVGNVLKAPSVKRGGHQTCSMPISLPEQHTSVGPGTIGVVASFPRHAERRGEPDPRYNCAGARRPWVDGCGGWTRRGSRIPGVRTVDRGCLRHHPGSRAWRGRTRHRLHAGMGGGGIDREPRHGWQRQPPLGITVVSFLLAAVIGEVALRRGDRFGVAGFAGLTHRGWATARNPQSPFVSSWFWALVAAGLGIATLRFLCVRRDARATRSFRRGPRRADCKSARPAPDPASLSASPPVPEPSPSPVGIGRGRRDRGGRPRPSRRGVA